MDQYFVDKFLATDFGNGGFAMVVLYYLNGAIGAEKTFHLWIKTSRAFCRAYKCTTR